MPKNSEKLKFEAISEELEELTSQLENSDAMSLEASLEAFETGIKLTREAQQVLSEAEQKVQTLIEKNGDTVANCGKRIRTVPVNAAALAVEPEYQLSDLDPYITAIELIHTYSLVHDDLPAMDDDDLRRGKPRLSVQGL